jgi:2-dehydropantoate 2-reductase
MRIAVVGTGPVGAYFGGRLAQAGEKVIFLARGEHLRALRESGLRFDSVDGNLVLDPVHATDDAATVGPVDVALLAVKGWQVPQAIEVMRPLVGAETVVVPLLNGVEAPEQVAETFGAEHTAGGLCGLLGSVVASGHFRNSLPRPFISFGALDGSRDERLERLREAYEHAGVPVDLTQDIRAALWQKLLFVGPFGAVGAVTPVPVGVLRALPETRALLVGAMTEIEAVAHARGIALAGDALAKALALVDGLPPEGTASMQRDIMAGRPSEMESQVGIVVRAGQSVSVGVDVPRHVYLYASLLPQERLARGELATPAW